MAYKAILVPFSGEPHSAAALGTALRVAGRFDSQVEILHVETDPCTAALAAARAQAMERKVHFNFWYFVVALSAIMMLQQWLGQYQID